MLRRYKCLPQLEFIDGEYKLVSIRDEDKFDIMRWRNEQIDILRQKEPLTQVKQEIYFSTVVESLFKEEKPPQLLFSFLHTDVLIGYGGLVHIDWESANGEVSFITVTERNLNPNQFINDWKCYLKILKVVAYQHLKFNKIYTYAYDLRPNLYKALLESNFIEEARLKNHIAIGGELKDVLIHSHFNQEIRIRPANEEDALLYFSWANEEEVRRNSFSQAPIEFVNHMQWFNKQINCHSSLLFVVLLHRKPIGQIRFDEKDHGSFEIDFSIDVLYRGKGYGSTILKLGIAELFRNKENVKFVIGKVKKGNLASSKSFISAGFTAMVSSDPEINIFLFQNEQV